MGKQRFTTGEIIRIDQTWYRIEDCLINNCFILYDLSKGELIVKSLDELMDLWSDGRTRIEN